MTTTQIGIERIATGTVIDVPGFGSAEVYECNFDGSGYSVTYCTDDRLGWDSVDHTYLDAGTMVEAYDHQTFLRAEQDISADELRAKIDALDAATFTDIAKANAICADMRGDVPALQAAE